MNTNRLGCLSPTAIIASLLTMIVIIGLELTSGNSLFSAGNLNAQAGRNLGGFTSHAATGSECSLCHVAFWESGRMADRCLACHRDVAAQAQDAATMHGAILKGRTPGCRSCHPEHRGAEAPLTEIRNGAFPHETVGFSLRGHQRFSDGRAFACADCHNDDITRFDLASCASCHQQMDAVFAQAHNLAYGADCLACHDGVDALGKDFNHNRFVFPLKGKHAGLICSKCHLNARAIGDFKTASATCATCHQKDEPHAGRFGPDCGECHSAEGWKPAKFDHNLSAFKLEGKHTEVKCEQCHTDGAYKGTPATCFACHEQDDEHNGQYGQDCAQCHHPGSWEDATFDHNLAAFKLEGKHVEVECKKCHVDNVFKGTASTCFACHEQDDEHNGQYGQDCAQCHNPGDWHDATFDHNLAAFRLTGAHVKVACKNCHTDNVFKGTPAFCSGCHGNPAFHAGMFARQQCSECHNTSAWIPGTYNGPHPGIADEHGSGVNHGGEGCRSCHTANLSTATCLKCHDSNNPDGDNEKND